MFSKVLPLTVAGAASLTAFGASAQNPSQYPSQNPSQHPSQNLSQTCAYRNGPLAGRTIDYSRAPGAVSVRIGSRCTDLQGSSGQAVAQGTGRPSQSRFYTSPGAPSPWSSSGQLKSGYTRTCRFNSGPRAGTSADFSGTLGAQPVAIGASCSDGASKGVGVARGR